ncbi:GntR family transcriptional regulator [Pseudomonas oryzihabitans]|uniref:GntR family transcriptional regulator n=1 Tax=Pseudomonas oryzihabitans TaxID=47885 RepID=UPI0011A62429|nr:GntR family transcriptional regulator [Pseudomonas oryzihabitans]HJE69202.1 GntR family transcriptional regulator [Pseudomonas oryzihabitans]
MTSVDVRLPLYQQLRDDLATAIARQQWRPGEAIPTEAVLCERYAVSPGTVRKALDLLVEEGVLERFQGRGTFVRRPQFDHSLFRFFRFEDANGERVVPDSHILLREQRQATADVAKALQLAEGSAVIHLHRLRLIAGRAVLEEHIWLDATRFGALLDIPLEAFGPLLYPLYEQHCGEAVARAEEQLSVTQGAADSERLLQLPAGQPLAQIERLALGYDGRPLEWRCSRGDALTFRYRTEIR